MNSTDLYVFSSNSAHERGWAYAWQIVSDRPAVREQCPVCGGISKKYLGTMTLNLEGGSKYPDLLLCGEYPFLFVSERTLCSWRHDKLQAFENFPVQIGAVPKKLREQAAPHYFRIEIAGKCEVDLDALPQESREFCRKCGRYLGGVNFDGFKLKHGFWDGASLFRDAQHFPTCWFCDRKVFDVATRERLTNFRFEPLAGPFNAASKGIPYLEKKSSRGK
jgi:hypothetical protein